METLFTANYIISDKNACGGKTEFKFFGTRFKEYYKSLEELKSDIKNSDIANKKNVIQINIQKHNVETIETININN